MDFIFDYPILMLITDYLKGNKNDFSLIVTDYPKFMERFHSFATTTSLSNPSPLFKAAFEYYQRSMVSFIAQVIFPGCVGLVVIGMIHHVWKFRSFNSIFLLIMTVMSLFVYVVIEGNIEKELPAIISYDKQTNFQINGLVVKVALGHLLLNCTIILGLILLISDYIFQSDLRMKNKKE